MDTKDKYIKQVCDGFQTNKGKGSVYCFPPLKFEDLVAEVIAKYRYKRPNAQILVVVDIFIQRLKIIEKLRSVNIDFGDIKILTKEYIKDSANYCQNFIIAVDVKDYFIISKFHNSSQFTLAIYTSNPMNNQFIIDVRGILPEINANVGTNEIIFDRIKTPIKEYRIGVDFSDDDLSLYNKYNNYIKEAVAVFGNFDNIQKCRVGDAATNMSAADFREQLAYNNGWNKNLDTTIEFNKQIDNIYNPNILYEKANTIYNITRERANLMTDNKNKLAEILKIITGHYNERIIIICKRGEFANVVFNFINNNTEFSCGAYHDDIESTYLYDDNGNVITYKSGENKGKPKPFCARKLSSLSLEKFNNGQLNILIVKNNLPQDISTKTDVVIFTSPLCMDNDTFILKYINIELPNPIVFYQLFMNGSVEYNKLSQRQLKSNVTLIEETKNIEFDEESGDIIL